MTQPRVGAAGSGETTSGTVGGAGVVLVWFTSDFKLRRVKCLNLKRAMGVRSYPVSLMQLAAMRAQQSAVGPKKGTEPQDALDGQTTQ